MRRALGKVLEAVKSCQSVEYFSGGAGGDHWGGSLRALYSHGIRAFRGCFSVGGGGRRSVQGGRSRAGPGDRGPAQRLLRARRCRGAARACVGQQGWGRLREAPTASGKAPWSRRGAAGVGWICFSVSSCVPCRSSPVTRTAPFITPD